jgi:class 3 adenylate cyclase/tetratricopeptide (TPR) repeat protein
MTDLTRFVPSQLLERTASPRNDGPACVGFAGAVIFADISDYTPLAERFCEQGIEGAEQLAGLLDRTFSHYIACIHHSGGEVASFAGDALLAYWSAPHGDLAGALQSALTCASALHGASPGGCSDSPQLHVGLAAGPLWVARLGGIDGRWQILLAGDAVRDAAQAAAAASRGETVLSERAQTLAAAPAPLDRHPGEIEEMRRIPSASQTSPQGGAELGLLVPRILQERGQGTAWKWLPQVRNICALFVRIDGLDENAPDALDRYQAAVIEVERAVLYSSRSASSLSLGDKGLVYRLCFGLPHDSHADDALRAARAGLAIVQGLKRLDLGCAAGLAIGRGLYSAIGGSERQDYVAVGRFMHLAARLMENAGQGLLCSAEVAGLLRGKVDWIPEKPLSLKGIRDNFDVIRAQAVTLEAEPREKIFGRESEKYLLESRLGDLARGQGALVWIAGDAGIGKSALVLHLIEVAASRDIVCLAGDSASAENAVPYLAWRPIFARLLKVDWPNTAAAVRGSTAHTLPSYLKGRELAPLINSVLPGLLGETPLVSGLTGRARSEATLSFLGEVIRNCAGDSFLLVLEDCHWIDSASWRLLERIARDFPRALLVLTSRPHFESRELGVLRGVERFTELTLSPLHADAVGEIVKDVLADADAPSQIVEEVVTRSGGNPFFAREYALLLQSGARAKRPGAKPDPSGALSFVPNGAEAPITVQGLVTSRIDSLGADEVFILKAASVLGNQLEVPVLKHVLFQELQDSQLDSTLSALVQYQLLAASDDAERSYQFRHDIIRRVAYDQLTSSQREKLHADAARAIESVHGNRLELQFAILAHHWSMARVPIATIKYADLAAKQALESAAYAEADRLLQTCLELSERSGVAQINTETLVRWHRELADAYQGLGQVEKRGIEARRALALAGRPRPSRLAGVVAHGVLRAARSSWRHVIARPIAATDPRQTLTLDLAKAYRHSAAVCWFSNDSLGMTCDILGAVECGETAPASSVLASAYAELGGILGVIGLRKIGEPILRRALGVAQTSGNVSDLAYVHLLNSLYAVGMGDWSTASRSSELCQEICERTRDQVNWSNAQAVRFWLNHYQTRSELARALAHALQDRAAETGNRQHQAWALRFLAVCDLRQGNPVNAALQLEQALERLGETAAVNERIPILGSLALARTQLGELAAAGETLGEGLALVNGLPRPAGHATLEGYSALAEVALNAWHAAPGSMDRQRAASLCLRALRRYQATFPIGEARYRLWQGRYRQLAGRNWAARLSFQRGAAAAKRRGMAWDEARCLEALTSVPSAGVV